MPGFPCSYLFAAPRLLRWVGRCSGVALLLPWLLTAQGTAYLGIDTIELGPLGPTELTYRDLGTGSTNYSVEFVTELTPAGVWTNLEGATVAPMGGGVFRVSLPESESMQGYFRIRGDGGSTSVVTAIFDATSLRVTEGGTVAPTIVFSAPFYGTIRYSLSGTLGAGEIEPLSGEVVVNGATAATIPVSVLDNSELGTLKYLTLQLEVGPGYELGTTTQATVTAEDNDASWAGGLESSSGKLGFRLTLLQSGEALVAGVMSDGFGFFPTNETPAQVTFNDDLFDAMVRDIPIPSDATPLGEPSAVTLELHAANATAGQLVSEDWIHGSARIVTHWPTLPHLDTTNNGTFMLVKPAITASTNEVQLANTP